jgi:hypothetical protein
MDPLSNFMTPAPHLELSQPPPIPEGPKTITNYPTENFLKAQSEFKPILKQFSAYFHKFFNSAENTHDRKILFQDYNTIVQWLNTYVPTSQGGKKRKTKKKRYSTRK